MFLFFFFVFVAFLLLIVILVSWRWVWVPLMNVVTRVLLHLTRHDPALAHQSLSGHRLALSFLIIIGACTNSVFFNLAMPAAMQIPNAFSTETNWLLDWMYQFGFWRWLFLGLLWLIIFLLPGGVLAGIVRFGAVSHDWPAAVASLGILVFPLVGFLVGTQVMRVVEADTWHKLGSPPVPATRIVGADLNWLAIETANSTIYTCCTTTGKWQMHDQLPDTYAFSVKIEPPEYQDGRWICTHCGFGIPAKSTSSMTTPAPPRELTQPTWFSVVRTNGEYSGDYAYGGAGIAADGQVWEWRDIGSYEFLSFRLEPWYLTPHEALRVWLVGLWGAGVGLLGSVILAWQFWRIGNVQV